MGYSFKKYNQRGCRRSLRVLRLKPLITRKLRKRHGGKKESKNEISMMIPDGAIWKEAGNKGIQGTDHRSTFKRTSICSSDGKGGGYGERREGVLFRRRKLSEFC